MAASRVGFWYATGPAEKEYRPGAPEFSVHTVVSDLSEFPAHVTIENAATQQFPVALALIESIASPPGHIYLFAHRAQVRQNGETRPRIRPQDRPLAIPATPGTSEIVDFYPHWDVAASG